MGEAAARVNPHNRPRPARLADVRREGIRGLAPAEVRAARAAGTPYKRVCQAEVVDGGVVAGVRPERLPLTDPLAAVRGASLLLHCELETVRGLTIGEHPGGPDTTAYGVLTNLVTLAREWSRGDSNP